MSIDFPKMFNGEMKIYSQCYWICCVSFFWWDICLSSEWHSLIFILLNGNVALCFFSKALIPHPSIHPPPTNKWQKTNLIFQDFVVVRLGFHEWFFMAFLVFTCDEIEWLSVKRAGEKFMLLVIKVRVAQHVHNVRAQKMFSFTFF